MAGWFQQISLMNPCNMRIAMSLTLDVGDNTNIGGCHWGLSPVTIQSLKLITLMRIVFILLQYPLSTYITSLF